MNLSPKLGVIVGLTMLSGYFAIISTQGPDADPEERWRQSVSIPRRASRSRRERPSSSTGLTKWWYSAASRPRSR